MTIEKITEKVKSFIETIDKEEYPELHGYFTSVVEENIWQDTAYGVSSVIFNCDKTKSLPKCVADLLVEIYTDEIEENDHNAMCDFGALYYTGRIGEQSYEKAVHYYEMSAKLGNRQAQENLGYCYYYGRVGAVDFEKAYHQFIKGALDNRLVSLYKIGDMYKNGYYVEKDENEAFCIYLRCLEGLTEDNTPILGADVHIRVADCYYYGIGVKQRLERALTHYQFAERLYWDRLQEGDFLIKKQFERSIEMQDRVRAAMRETIPNFKWTNQE